ncbi:hypothetical protein J6590_067007 [Homalodisca vitripennis]|nr:hypothetical protein J6590_067007 [Homalodisca vitripennis]
MRNGLDEIKNKANGKLKYINLLCQLGNGTVVVRENNKICVVQKDGGPLRPGCPHLDQVQIIYFRFEMEHGVIHHQGIPLKLLAGVKFLPFTVPDLSLYLFCRVKMSLQSCLALNTHVQRGLPLFRELKRPCRGVRGASRPTGNFRSSAGSTRPCRVSRAQHSRLTKPSVVQQAQHLD